MTRGRRLQTRLPYAALAAALLFAIGAALAVSAPAARAATPAKSEWRVVWIDGSRIYMATRDTVPLDPGQPVTFLQSRKTLASGEVEQMLDRALAVVRLESGSLEKTRHAERVVVRLDAQALEARPLLRLGLPGARANPLYDCRPDTTLAPPWRERYRLQPGPRGTLDLVRSDNWAGTRWPDTVRVRRFDDVADEEIALARGEVDAAVFGPGEASAHLRADSRWRSALFAAHGMLVTTGTRIGPVDVPTRLSARDQDALHAVGTEVLRGDVEWLPPQADDAGVIGMAFWEVRRSCPGHTAMQKYFDAARASAAEPGPTLTLEYANRRHLSDRLLATVRCPVVSDPIWRPYLRSLGIDAFAHVFECPVTPTYP
jgi:hypothetical protein